MSQHTTTDREAVVEVSELRKTYKGGNVLALNGISFTVGRGEIFGLIGPNGAGKTTLIGCLLGLLQPDSGSVKVMGRPADCLSVRQLTGYVPERSDFEYWMTARQFLKYHHGLARRNPGDAEREIAGALETVELAESVWNRRLRTYSRGMLQRLNLAQLIIGKPRLMLLDEPTLGLDPTGVSVVRKIINNMRSTGVTAIINSHQLDEVERLCDRVAFIRQGKIASIENIKGGNITDYTLFVRWTENRLNGTLASIVSKAAASCSAVVNDCQHEWGRFIVKDAGTAADLIKELISSGVPVEEAVPERMRLEQLFRQDGSSADNGGNAHE